MWLIKYNNNNNNNKYVQNVNVDVLNKIMILKHQTTLVNFLIIFLVLKYAKGNTFKLCVICFYFGAISKRLEIIT